MSTETRRNCGRLRLKCDGTCAETKFCLSAKLRSPLSRRGASVQSTTGSRGVCISGSNAVYIMFRDSEKGTGYPLHSPVFPSLPFSRASPCAIAFQLDCSAVSRSRSAHLPRWKLFPPSYYRFLPPCLVRRRMSWLLALGIKQHVFELCRDVPRLGSWFGMSQHSPKTEKWGKIKREIKNRII
jgi:hypothetical protein